MSRAALAAPIAASRRRKRNDIWKKKRMFSLEMNQFGQCFKTRLIFDFTYVGESKKIVEKSRIHWNHKVKKVN